MSTNDIHPDAPMISWPESVDVPPAGWHWGRHVSAGDRGTGYYMIRDTDGATLIAMQRPDMSDVPTDDEIAKALGA